MRADQVPRPMRHIALVSLCLLALSTGFGCNLGSRGAVDRSFLGIDRHQALVVAHRVLTQRSFQVQVDRGQGTLETAWRDDPHRSLRYFIAAGGTSGDAAEIPSVNLQIRAEARDRAVRGWTDPYPAPDEARWLAYRIARALDDFDAPVIPPDSPPERAEESDEPPQERRCATSRECPPGQHCGTGRCVWECALDEECEGDAVCDRRGRCVRPPPPPPTCPLPSPEQPTEEAE